MDLFTTASEVERHRAQHRAAARQGKQAMDALLNDLEEATAQGDEERVDMLLEICAAKRETWKTLWEAADAARKVTVGQGAEKEMDSEKGRLPLPQFGAAKVSGRSRPRKERFDSTPRTQVELMKAAASMPNLPSLRSFQLMANQTTAKASDMRDILSDMASQCRSLQLPARVKHGAPLQTIHETGTLSGRHIHSARPYHNAGRLEDQQLRALSARESRQSRDGRHEGSRVQKLIDERNEYRQQSVELSNRLGELELRLQEAGLADCESTVPNSGRSREAEEPMNVPRRTPSLEDLKANKDQVNDLVSNLEYVMSPRSARAEAMNVSLESAATRMRKSESLTSAIPNPQIYCGLESFGAGPSVEHRPKPNIKDKPRRSSYLNAELVIPSIQGSALPSPRGSDLDSLSRISQSMQIPSVQGDTMLDNHRLRVSTSHGLNTVTASRELPRRSPRGDAVLSARGDRHTGGEGEPTTKELIASLDHLHTELKRKAKTINASYHQYCEF